MISKTKLPIYALFAAFILAIAGTSGLYAGDHGGGKDKMKMMDTDGDGAVSKEEFMSHKEQRFMKKDANGDGVLTEDEMKGHCKLKDKKNNEE